MFKQTQSMFLTLFNQLESLQALTENAKYKSYQGYCSHTDQHRHTLGTFCTAHWCPRVSLSHETPASPVPDPVTQVAQNYPQNAQCDLPSSTTPHSHPHTHTVTSFSQPLHKLLLFFHIDTASTLASHFLCFLFPATFHTDLFRILVYPFSPGLLYNPISANSQSKLCLPKNATYHKQDQLSHEEVNARQL